MLTENERKEIAKKYKNLLRVWKNRSEKKDIRIVRKALDVALDAHKDMRRLSGEPYIYHPLEVARICAKEMNLGTVSIISALLHDVVEDTRYTIEDIEDLFSPEVATIVDGLTKIKEIFDESTQSIQTEYFKKIIIAFSHDARIILIKIADRLHNMQTLQYMERQKQLKISSETLMLFAPLAYRMSLYNIKTELENLSLQYTNPQIYQHIQQQLQETESDRKRFIRKFIYPIKNVLIKHDIPNEIQIRTKSVYSIWQKMEKKNIPFDDVYDVFAVRIIIESDLENEIVDCWKVFSLIIGIYKPRHDRIRDWITIPKANGYEALHFTVMSHEGKWVEIQIRTKRMHELAEEGYASHQYYKKMPKEERSVEKWLKKIREVLQNAESNAVNFVDDFKLDLYFDEIYTFTPKGKIIKLPIGATALDFAYAIHTEVGSHSIAAKVNLTLMPLNHKLKSGDQVEIITSKIQKPNEEWLKFVITARARNFINETLKSEKRKYYKEGRKKLQSYFKELGIEFNTQNIEKFKKCNHISNATELYYLVAIGRIGLKDVKNCSQKDDKSTWLNIINPFSKSHPAEPKSLSEILTDKLINKPEELLLGEKTKIEYKIASCCNPIPGDDVIGIIMPDKPIMIHRSNCKIVINLMSSFGNRIVKVKWNKKDPIVFLAGIEFTGIDKVGFIFQMTDIISNKYKIRIRSFHLDSSNEVTSGKIMLYVHDTKNLNNLISDLKKIKEAKKITRLNPV